MERDIRLAGNPPCLGEVREPGDWLRVPANRAVRAVYLIDDCGPVIRWVSGDNHAGVYHEHLENGDGDGLARSGYLRRRLDGSIEVL